MEGSRACFRRPYHRDRIHVRKSVQHSLQPCRCGTQSHRHDTHEEVFRLQSPWHQCCRRCFPQHRTADHCKSHHNDFRPDLLCTGSSDLRCHHRASNRNPDERSFKTNPFLNKTCRVLIVIINTLHQFYYRSLTV